MLAVVWRLLGVVVFFVLFLEFCRNSNEKILIPWVCHSKRFEKLYALVCDIIRMVKSWLSLSVYFTVFCELDRLCRSNPDRVKRDETFYRSAQWRLSNENANTNKTIGSISSTVSIGWRNVADACVWNLTVLLSAVSSEIPIFVLFLSLRCISVDNGLLPHYSFRFQLNSSGYNINSHYQLHCTFSIHSYWNYDSFVFIFIFILFVHIVLRHSVRLLFFFFFFFVSQKIHSTMHCVATKLWEFLRIEFVLNRLLRWCTHQWTILLLIYIDFLFSFFFFFHFQDTVHFVCQSKERIWNKNYAYFANVRSWFNTLCMDSILLYLFVCCYCCSRAKWKVEDVWLFILLNLLLITHIKVSYMRKKMAKFDAKHSVFWVCVCVT